MLKTKSIKIILPLLILVICFVGIYSARPNSALADEKATVNVASDPQTAVDGISFVGAYTFIAENIVSDYADYYLGSVGFVWWIPNECFNPENLEYFVLSFPFDALEAHTLDYDFYSFCKDNSNKVHLYYFGSCAFSSDIPGDASPNANGGSAYFLKLHGYSQSSDLSDWNSVDEKVSYCFGVLNSTTKEIAYTPVVTFSYNSVPSASDSYNQDNSVDLSNYVSLTKYTTEVKRLQTEIAKLKATEDSSEKEASSESNKTTIILLTVLGAVVVCCGIYSVAEKKKK